MQRFSTILALSIVAFASAALTGCGSSQPPPQYVSDPKPRLDVTAPDAMIQDQRFRLAVDVTLTNQSDSWRMTCNVADFTLIMGNGTKSVQPDAGSSCDDVVLAPHTATTVHLFFANYNAQQADYKIFWEDGAASGDTFGSPREEVAFSFNSGMYGHGSRGY